MLNPKTTDDWVEIARTLLALHRSKDHPFVNKVSYLPDVQQALDTYDVRGSFQRNAGDEERDQAHLAD